MKPFSYHQPSTLDEAVGLLDRHGPAARPLAGGQSLLLELKERRARPAVLVSLAGLAELTGWQRTDAGELEIGATTTYAALATADLPGWLAEITAVAGNLADRPVRTMGTIGGALCQADARFDFPTLMVGVGATIDTVDRAGTRTRDAADLFAAQGGSTLGPGELLTRVRMPGPQAWSGVAFEKFRIRLFDAALASVVCALALGQDGRVARARLTVGAATPAPVLSTATVGLLTGRAAGDPCSDIGLALADEVLPSHTATTQLRRYQRELLPTLANRAIARAFEQSGS